ncbi:two-partner secretion domain-containing protein [Providencia huaxiensis]|uniref:two-partner secretion domain-containing protein n=1 Tax=Providencia huaxiensis TaxID=2027290 RepID=UPI0034DD6AB3
MSLPIKSGSSTPTLKLKPIVLCVSAILGVTSIAHAEIINTNGAGVMNQNNGPTIVHINKPSDKGVSHNIYSKFDVDKNGAILNNSKDNVNTQLGGLINGNLNLSGGEAKVILNEVNSNNATTLNGMVEVAGKKAQVIVANPSGITCNSCGFINTESTTLTTGKPLVSNGELLGYNVAKGQIIVNNSLNSDSPTELISRSALINGRLKAEEIKVVTGNNFVDANGTAVTSVAGTGSRPSVGIDVSALGGMYADKITLITTEGGVGVKNQGTILAGDQGLSVNTAGGLTNYKRIESSGNININADTLDNSEAAITAKQDLNIIARKPGEIDTTFNNQGGRLTSTSGDINLTSHSLISNTRGGIINAKNNVGIKSNVIQNGGGLIKTETGDINVDTRDTLYQWRDTSRSEDRIIAGRDVNINAGRIYNENAKIKAGRDVNITVGYSEITNSSITANRKLALNAYTLKNKASSITAKNAKLDLIVSDEISNDANSIISSGRGLNITANKLTNKGKIVSATNTASTTPTYISNIKVNNIQNNGGHISGDQLNIESNTIDNGLGFINANKLNVDANSLSNSGGYIRSYNDITLNVNQLYNTYSNNFNQVAYKFGLANNVGGIETLDGGITVNGDIISSDYGFFKSEIRERAASKGGIEFNLTGNFDNRRGELNSDRDIVINAKEIYNYDAKINSGAKIKLKGSDGIYHRYSELNSKDVTELYTPYFSSTDYNQTYSLDGTGIIYNTNGPNIIHIKKPTDKGISHNTFDSFNVSEKGVIFNNSSSTTNTQLAGSIFGNSNLTAGNEAKVILNEVVSNKTSVINGMMEVAGKTAQVIVANASGITCNSCGFINASRGAFVAGTPLMAGDNLIGYNVNKGKITVNNHLTSNNTIDLISSAVLVKGKVEANELNISAGASLFDPNGKTLSSLSEASYDPNFNGITVDSKGSLNANKINLNVNVKHNYLKNKGLINAGNGGLTVDSYSINNTGTIKSKGDINITGTPDVNYLHGTEMALLNDKGTIISTDGSITITAITGYIANMYDGLISAKKNVNLNLHSTSTINNTGGLVLAEQGDINVKNGLVYNRQNSNSKYGKNRLIAGRDINITDARIINEHSAITAGRDFSFTGTELENRSSAINANRRVNIDGTYLSNKESVIKAETGRMDITASREIINDTVSTISSDKLMNITSPKLTNVKSSTIVSNNGKSTFNIGNLVNNLSYIKGFDSNFISKYLDNSSGLIKADNNIVMNAEYVSNTNAADFKRGTFHLGLSSSQKGGIIANDGSINIKGYQLNNKSGIIQTNAIFPAAGQADIDITMGNEIINNYAQINSAGNLNASANEISNYDGIMSAGLDLTAKADYSISNYYGKISSGDITTLITPYLDNKNGKITGYPVIIENN